MFLAETARRLHVCGPSDTPASNKINYILAKEISWAQDLKCCLKEVLFLHAKKQLKL